MLKIVPSPRKRALPSANTKRRVSFAKADITRAVSAAQRVGFRVRSIEISQDGRIRLCSDDREGEPNTLFDAWEPRL